MSLLRFDHLGTVDSARWLRTILRDLTFRAWSTGGFGGWALSTATRFPSGRRDKKKPIVVKPLDHVGERLVLYAHFDANAELSAADRFALEAYRATGYQVCAVTTSASWPEQYRDLVDALIVRPNLGFDFGSWSTAIQTFLPREKRESISHLVLVNNSVYGPLWPVDELFHDAEHAAEVVGLTLSRELIPHLQSYFLSFSGRSVRSEAFDEFWLQDFSSSSKWFVIGQGELRWGRHFQRAGFDTSYLICPQSHVRRNELTFYWVDLVKSGLPYVKKSLFRANLDNINLGDWREKLLVLAPRYDPTLIEMDVKR